MATTATATTLRLNGFRLEPSTESFTAYRSPMPADGDLRELRRSTQATWTVYREDDEVLAVPRQDPPPIALGVAEEIRCVDHLSFLAYLIDAALPRAVPRPRGRIARAPAPSPSNRSTQNAETADCRPGQPTL